jgi:chromatin remodeling complex protein RSC6
MSSNTSSDNTKMSAAMKKSSTKTAKTVVAEPVAVAVAAVPEVVAAKAPKAPKAKAPKAEKKEVVEAAVPVATEPAVATPAEAVADEDMGAALQKSITDLQEQLASLKTAASAAATALKTIEKQAARLAKKADRRRKRKTEAVEGAEPKPCIFTKPVKITAELCSFLGKPKDTEVSRSSVTKGVMEYARNNNLMDKQTIKADAALRKLLTLNEGDVLTILNLQKFLRRHYVKAPVAATA